jgi:hypothetical protein
VTAVAIGKSLPKIPKTLSFWEPNTTQKLEKTSFPKTLVTIKKKTWLYIADTGK